MGSSPVELALATKRRLDPLVNKCCGSPGNGSVGFFADVFDDPGPFAPEDRESRPPAWSMDGVEVHSAGDDVDRSVGDAVFLPSALPNESAHGCQRPDLPGSFNRGLREREPTQLLLTRGVFLQTPVYRSQLLQAANWGERDIRIRTEGSMQGYAVQQPSC